MWSLPKYSGNVIIDRYLKELLFYDISRLIPLEYYKWMNLLRFRNYNKHNSFKSLHTYFVFNIVYK